MEAIPFINRDQEIRQFQNMLPSQDTQAVLISGREGMGKTALLREFVTFLEANADFLAIYRAVQPEVGLSPTLLDIELDLRNVLDPHTIDATEEVFSPRLSTTLRRKVRITGSGIECLDSATTMNEVITTFAESLTEISQRLERDRKLVLMFDVQPGLDTRSKEALIHLHSSLPKGVKLVLAFADAENGSESRLYIPQLRLLPLTKEYAEAILRTCVDSLSADLFETIWQHFRGHPLALATLARLLGNGYPSSRDELPTSLSGLFDALLEDVDEADRRIIQVLAILFEPADIALIANISGLTAKAVEQIISRDRVWRLLDWEKLSQERLQLFHPLLGEHVVRDSLRPILRELHTRAAKHYGHDFETYWHNPRALGYCLEHLRLSDTVEYIRFVTSPEVRVLMQIWGTSDLASFHLQEALKGMPHAPERVWVQLVDSDDKVTLQELNVPSGLIPSESLLLRDLGYFSRLDGDSETAAEYYRRALQVLEEDQRSAESASNLSQQAEIWMEFAELYRAQAMHGLAIEALERSKDFYELLLLEDSEHAQPWTGYLCRCWHNIGVTLRDIGLREKRGGKSADAGRSFQQAVDAFHQALELTEEDNMRVDELIQVGYAHFELAEIKQVLEKHVQETEDHLKEATHAYEEALAIARRVSNIEAIAIASGNLSSLSLQARLPGEAARHAQAAIDAFEQLGMIEAVDQARTLLEQAQAQLSNISRGEADHGRGKRE